jgi:hypothetical protein
VQRNLVVVEAQVAENFDRFTKKSQGEAMSNFRIKVLGLTALATAFAGLSYGQSITCTGALTSVSVAGPTFSNPTLRAEGETELVADVQATTCTTTATTTGAVFATLNLPITSKLISATGYTGNSDATLLYTQGGVTTPYPGTVTGEQVSFSGVTFTTGAAFNLEIANVRVNATGATSPQVTETVDIQYTSGGLSTNYNPATAAGAQDVSNNQFQIGYILASLGATNFAGTAPFNVTNYTVCSGNPLPAGGTTTVSATNLAFTVNIKELVGGAFKTQAEEVGAYIPAGANATGIGTATSSDEIVLTLGNVPASATVYLPQTLTVNGTTIALTTSSVATTPAAINTLGNQAAFTPSNGTVTATYTVTAAVSTGASTFPITVYPIFAANSAPAQGAITALTSYAPAAAVTGPASGIPTFAVSTATPINGSTITICQTTLMFPYVTNATGFETGIAISNTTTDNLKTTGGSVATPTNGTCTLNFYGNAAQPTATVTPTLGAYSAAAPTVVPVFANILTNMVGSGGFSGYAIAQCNFQEAHGFAFITDTTGTFSGTEGYLAVIVPNTRGENTETSLSVSVTITPGGGAASLGVATTASGSGSATGTISNVGQ